jgi:Cytochrome P460
LPPTFTLPADLAKYREWTSLLQHPHGVPMELWDRCMAPSPEEWGAARRKFGPHTQLLIMVDANPTASASIAAGSKRAFPVGSIIAKEKLAHSPETVEGVAFMVKQQRSAFPETGGWEFRYFPSPPDARATHEACASCHRAVSTKDYEFGQYPG